MVSLILLEHDDISEGAKKVIYFRVFVATEVVILTIGLLLTLLGIKV